MPASLFKIKRKLLESAYPLRKNAVAALRAASLVAAFSLLALTAPNHACSNVRTFYCGVCLISNLYNIGYIISIKNFLRIGGFVLL